MNLPKLQALIAPFATPTGPALFLANELYTVAMKVEIPHWLSVSTAITTIVGVEFSGALMCYCAVEAWRRHSYLAMGLSIIGAFVYAAIVIGGFVLMPEERSQIFGVMVLLTLVAYLGYAIYSSFEKQDETWQSQTAMEIELLNARTRKTNAETRKAKVGVFAVRPTNEHEQSSVRGRVFAVLSERSGIGPREMARTVKCSVSTASKWIKEYRNGHN